MVSKIPKKGMQDFFFQWSTSHILGYILLLKDLSTSSTTVALLPRLFWINLIACQTLWPFWIKLGKPHWIPVCCAGAWHVFSQGLCVEVLRVGNTCIPHPLVDPPDLSLSRFLCVTLAVGRGWPLSSQGGGTCVWGNLAAKNKLVTHLCWSHLFFFTTFLTSNSAWAF